MRHFTLFLMFIIVLLPGCKNKSRDKNNTVIIFHAGSLSVPFKAVADEYEIRNPGVKILLEPAGSLVCARKITELLKPCDIIASADYFVINELIVPDYADWSIRFATNEIVIAFNEKARYSTEIDSTSWVDILQRDDVIYGRSDPDSDPCGYRTVMTFMLAENFYKMPGLAEKFIKKDARFIRPKEVDLVALVESNAIDYMFQYKSVAIQHELKYIELPGYINLGDPDRNNIYNMVSLDITGSSPGSRITARGDYINYSLSVLRDAPNPEGAIDFVDFLLSREGMALLKKSGQDPIIPLMTEQPAEIPPELKKYLN